jgi:hypothetical protein
MVGEGLKRGIKRRNQGGGVKTLTGISMLEAGRCGWLGAVRRGGGAARIGRCEEGDKADWRAPYGSDVRERSHCRNVQTRRKDAFDEYTMVARAEWAEHELVGWHG